MTCCEKGGGMAVRDEYIYPWEYEVEQHCRVDFLFRTDVQGVIDGCPIGSDYRYWPRVYRVMLALRDERGMTSVFGRAYRKYLIITKGGGGLDMPTWWFDVAGRVPERYGFDPPVVRYAPSKTTGLGNGYCRIDEWVAENVIEL